MTSALQWKGGPDGRLELVDQRRLPGEYTVMTCHRVEDLYEAIRTLTVRGAPAIGVAAAYGLVLACQSVQDMDARQALAVLKDRRDYLASSRPTAVNLFWALDRVMARAHGLVEDRPDASMEDLHRAVFEQAQAICREDVEMCRQIGLHGRRFIREGMGVLTHCNAGALATAGQGTALSVLFEAHASGLRFTVYADETRPLLQGARLTAWELQRAGIETVLICDNMAGWLMRQGKVQAVITGADRIAANGDAANKIGTYGLSVLAARHGIPFYVAAPSSTFDLSIPGGEAIVIEQRDPGEVLCLAGTRTAPEGIRVYNPAFDVTQAGDIAAIITERGVIERPTRERIAEVLA